MSLPNLPPGIVESDLPGNSAEDAAFDKLYDDIAASGLSAQEARIRWETQPRLLVLLRRALDLPARLRPSDPSPLFAEMSRVVLCASRCPDCSRFGVSNGVRPCSECERRAYEETHPK